MRPGDSSAPCRPRRPGDCSSGALLLWPTCVPSRNGVDVIARSAIGSQFQALLLCDWSRGHDMSCPYRRVSMPPSLGEDRGDLLHTDAAPGEEGNLLTHM